MVAFFVNWRNYCKFILMKYLILFSALLFFSCKTKKEQIEDVIEETVSVAGNEQDSLFVT